MINADDVVVVVLEYTMYLRTIKHYNLLFGIITDLNIRGYCCNQCLPQRTKATGKVNLLKLT